jgi:hypothetical protein
MRMTTEQIIREHYRLVNECHDPSNDGVEMRKFKSKEWHDDDEDDCIENMINNSTEAENEMS